MTTNPVNNYTEMHDRLERLLARDDVQWHPNDLAIGMMKRCAFAAYLEANAGNASPIKHAQTAVMSAQRIGGGS